MHGHSTTGRLGRASPLPTVQEPATELRKSSSEADTPEAIENKLLKRRPDRLQMQVVDLIDVIELARALDDFRTW
jgi:hypothetical protein